MSDAFDDTLQREIDLLVGGDATKDETHRLVDRLDAHPDGWKQCALAFLEAQSWQRTFSAMLDAETNGRQELSPPTTTPDRQPVSPSPRNRILRTAVAVLIAFAAGIGATLGWQTGFADNRSEPEHIAAPQLPETPPSKRNNSSAPSNSEEPQLLGVVNISSNGRTEAAFPLVAARDRELVSIELTTDELNDYNRQLWERRGYRIEQHRKVVSMALADGSRFRFPIDWVHYRYVGERIY